jgi:DNA-binding MarR family transcriptional regulator
MEDLLFEINETARAIRRAFDQRAADMGVTRSQWRVLARLKRQPSLRQVELADILEVEPITLCRIVDRLEEAGLVERQPDPSDRRAWRLALTEKAQPVISSLRAVAATLADEAFGGLTGSDVDAFRRDLLKIRANLSTTNEKNRASA